MAIKLDAGDVTVRKIEREPCDCGKGACTHAVWLDMRNNGMSRAVYEGCANCANSYAKELEKSLPRDPRSP